MTNFSSFYMASSDVSSLAINYENDVLSLLINTNMRFCVNRAFGGILICIDEFDQLRVGFTSVEIIDDMKVGFTSVEIIDDMRVSEHETIDICLDSGHLKVELVNTNDENANRVITCTSNKCVAITIKEDADGKIIGKIWVSELATDEPT